MKRYEVTIVFTNNRANKLIEWADNEEEAKRLALRSWGNPTIYVELKAEDTQYI